MKVNIYTIVGFLAIIILVIFIGYKVLNTKSIKLSGDLGSEKIGKDLTIIITEDTIVDSTYIANVNAGEINHNKPFFDMIDRRECDKLIDYMADNEFIIKSGKYVINQTWSSENIIENLNFIKR